METKFIRVKKDRNYTVIDNHFIQDTRLSWKAKGVMNYLLSLPEDWEIRLSEIEKHATDGKESLRGAINELKKFSYIISMQTKNENGKFNEVKYIIIENPESEEESHESTPQSGLPISGKPYTEKPISGKPYTENPPLQSTNNNKVLNIQNTNNTNIYTHSDMNICKKEFSKPSVQDIQAYCEERQNNINAERFYDYYECKGWIVGKSKMKKL